jgi:hypothetical protein
VDVNLANSFMMRWRMMFCEIIVQILKTRAPVYIKLSLFHSVFYPIKAPIHCFCAFLFYCSIAVSCGSGIVCLHWCGGCGCPNSSNVVRRTAPSLEFMKTAPISASAAKDITCLRTLLIIKMALLVSFCSFLCRCSCKRTHLLCC